MRRYENLGVPPLHRQSHASLRHEMTDDRPTIGFAIDRLVMQKLVLLRHSAG